MNPSSRKAVPIKVMAMNTTSALYKLQSWLSPSYPVGAYAFSHGLENAVDTLLVTDVNNVTEWVGDTVSVGNGFADLVFLAAAWEAAAADSELSDIAELAFAFQVTSELRTESVSQGNAFLRATRKAWPCDALQILPVDTPATYPVAVGVTAAGHGIDKELAMHAYGHAFVANLVSAAIRLIPLGQTEGQESIAALEPVVAAAVNRARTTPLARVATSTMMVDIVSMHHETQHTRLFRS